MLPFGTPQSRFYFLTDDPWSRRTLGASWSPPSMPRSLAFRSSASAHQPSTAPRRQRPGCPPRRPYPGAGITLLVGDFSGYVVLIPIIHTEVYLHRWPMMSMKNTNKFRGYATQSLISHHHFLKLPPSLEQAPKRANKA